MTYHEGIKNYIFREFEYGLSINNIVYLCFKSVRIALLEIQLDLELKTTSKLLKYVRVIAKHVMI